MWTNKSPLDIYNRNLLRSEALASAYNYRTELLPFNCSWRLGADVVTQTVDASHFINNTT
jgi:hypothetical protein